MLIQTPARRLFAIARVKVPSAIKKSEKRKVVVTSSNRAEIGYTGEENEDLVIPCTNLLAVAGTPPSLRTLSFSASNSK